MRLAVLTAAVWPTLEEAQRKLWIFIESCKKFGIEPYFYGVGKGFGGYRHMCLDLQLEYLKTMSADITHVLYTDGADAFFVGPLKEIIEKYEAMGSPSILCSAFYQLGNVSDAEKDYPNCFDDTIRYKFPNRGAYIAELPVIIDAFDRMVSSDNLTGDDALSWYRGWKEGWFRPTLDSRCEIFQVADDDIQPSVDGTRIHNRHTGTKPCIWHLSGGYTSQHTMKDERMIPWALKLGIITEEQAAAGMERVMEGKKLEV